MEERNMSNSENQEILSRFSYHVADEAAAQQMEAIRVKVRDLAFLIQDLCPHSKEKATALTQLSFVMMAANSAIVQKCPIKV